MSDGAEFEPEEDDNLPIKPPSPPPIEEQVPSGHRSQIMIQPPLKLSSKKYSLEPDMISGWKPKSKPVQMQSGNVFPLNFNSPLVDECLKQLIRHPDPKCRIVYLGPRKHNSYALHADKPYDNPYPPHKKVDGRGFERPYMTPNFRLHQTKLSFDSDFEAGNLDAAVEVGDNIYDLLMRVDTNTTGHTNWYYFEVRNGDWTGTATFNLGNFRREKSLYQRGLKPYTLHRHETDWKQRGTVISYQRQVVKTLSLCEQDDRDDEISDSYHTSVCPSNTNSLSLMTLFVSPTVCLIISLNYNDNCHQTTLGSSLSGIAIPLVIVTNPDLPDYNKRVVLVSGRVHPGQSNSSWAVDGFLRAITSNDISAVQLRQKFIFHVIPMLNPDGVVAGNYRTSLFGKDLNRTYDQSRRFAFPETFQLMQYARNLKQQAKQRFILYLDMHGHSVKKNVFAYGPEYSVQHQFYQAVRELPRMLCSLTSMFRFYSCIFRISSEKATTARAVLNRNIGIPFTYTIECSNGFYHCSNSKRQEVYTANKWRQFGQTLAKCLNRVSLDTKMTRSLSQATQPLPPRSPEVASTTSEGIQQRTDSPILFRKPLQSQKHSDDEISEGGSDSQPEQEDLKSDELDAIESLLGRASIKSDKSLITSLNRSLPCIQEMPKSESRLLSKSITGTTGYLPPLNCFYRAEAINQRRMRRDTHDKLTRILAASPKKERVYKLTISQMVVEIKNQMFNNDKFPSHDEKNKVQKIS